MIQEQLETSSLAQSVMANVRNTILHTYLKYCSHTPMYSFGTQPHSTVCGHFVTLHMIVRAVVQSDYIHVTHNINDHIYAYICVPPSIFYAIEHDVIGTICICHMVASKLHFTAIQLIPYMFDIYHHHVHISNTSYTLDTH